MAHCPKCLFVLLVLGAVLPAVTEGSVYSDAVIANTSPVLYWNLDETSGTAATDLVPGVGGANDGTYMTGTTLGQAGPRPSDGFTHMGAANNAPGAGQPVGVRYPSLNTTADVAGVPYSAQTWFNSSVPFTDNVLNYFLSRGDDTTGPNLRDSLGVWGNYQGNPAKANRLFLFPGPAGGGTSINGTTVLSPNTWYHVLLVRDSASARVYLNGTLELENTWPWAGGTGGSGDEFRSGTRADAAHGLDGRTDEVAVWDRALSAHEANLLYHYALSPPYALAVLRDDPAAYWRLNETTPTALAADASGHGKAMAYFSSPTRTGDPPDIGPRPGDIVGGSPVFGFEAGNTAPTNAGSGTADGFFVAPGAGGRPTVHAPDDAYTVEFWVRPSITSGDVLGYAFQRRDSSGTHGFGDSLGLGIGYSAVTEGALFHYNGTSVYEAPDPTILQPNTWYHVAFMRAGDDISCYLNGQLEFSTTRPATGTFAEGTWTFGGRSDTAGLKWQGNMDEIAIFDRLLTQDEVLAHYYAAVVPEPATCVLLGGALVAMAHRRRRKAK